MRYKGIFLHIRLKKVESRHFLISTEKNEKQANHTFIYPNFIA